MGSETERVSQGQLTIGKGRNPVEHRDSPKLGNLRSIQTRLAALERTSILWNGRNPRDTREDVKVTIRGLG